MSEEERPNPEELLSAIKRQEKKRTGGLLKIFFGMSAGVGKTYAMLQEGVQRIQEGVDVVIGVIDTHGRIETEQLLQGYEIIPRKAITYRDSEFYEMDIDAVLQRKPKLVLVDELAHTNVPGARHLKRWQDVLELLEAGIDVYTTLNVQHLESRKDLVERIIGISIRETVPDAILERAVQIELVDISPEELLKRLKEGKVYLGPQSELAARNFFQEDSLTALREISLRVTAEKVDHDLHAMRLSLNEYGKGWQATERLLVAISSSPFSQQLIRAAQRIAFTLDAPWIALYVDIGAILTAEESDRLESYITLARDLGAEVLTIADSNLVKAIQRIVKQHEVTQIIIGRPVKNLWREIWEGGSLLDQLTTQLTDIDIHVIRQLPIPGIKKKRRFSFRPHLLLSYWKSLAATLCLAILGQLTKELIGYQSAGFLFLAGIMLLGFFARKGILFFTATLSALLWYFYFVPLADRLEIVNLALIALYFLAAAIIGTIAQRLQTNELLLKAHEEKTQAVYEIIKEIANAKSSADLMKAIEARLGRLLQGSCEIVLADPDKGELVFAENSLLLNDKKEQAVAIWVYKNGKAAGWSTDTLPLVKSLYIPMKGYKEVVGVIVYHPKYGRKLNMEEINLLYSVAQHIGNYLWRTFLEEKALKTKYIARIEKIHYAILKSLSFQPSPLPSPHIEKIEEEDSVLSLARQNGVIPPSIESSEELRKVIDNLLTMTKLSTGFFSPNKKSESIYELVNTCKASLEHFLAHYPLQIDLSGDIPSVMMDFSLMELLLCNLLINAAERSPNGSKIYLTVRSNEKSITITVADEGNAVSEECLATIFDTKMQGEHTLGAGLELKIAKNIAEVHQGSIRAGNRAPHGLEINVAIPIAPDYTLIG